MSNVDSTKGRTRDRADGNETSGSPRYAKTPFHNPFGAHPRLPDELSNPLTANTGVDLKILSTKLFPREDFTTWLIDCRENGTLGSLRKEKRILAEYIVS